MSRSPAPRYRDHAIAGRRTQGLRTTISNATNRRTSCRPVAGAGSGRRQTAQLPGPDPVARSLRTRRAGAVGLVITEPLTYAFSDPAALNFVAGLAESCEEFGQGLLLVACRTGRSVADGTNAVLSAGVDGFVVYAAADDHPYLQTALQRHLPVVIVDQPKNIPDASRVCIDDRAAMRGLAEHVIGLGHHEIALLTMRLGAERRAGDRTAGVVTPDRLQQSHFHVQTERIAGVREAMAAAGLDPDTLTVVESYEHLPASGGAAASWRCKPTRLTALMCTADVLALSAMDYPARAHGIYVYPVR